MFKLIIAGGRDFNNYDGMSKCLDRLLKNIKDWVKKCSEESLKPNTTVVMLIPARTDTSYFHDYIYQKPNVEIRFIRGRLKFGDGKNSAPFPSMVVIFKSKKDGT